MPPMSKPDLTPHPANPAPPSPDLVWPDGKSCVLFPGFDVDAEAVWLNMEPESIDKLVTMSYGGYEARVGVPKILELLARYEIRATFFIPGWTVEAHPAMCEAIVKAGHEVGHHGYLHKRPDPSRFDIAKEEIDRGFDALKRVLGVTPVGYRAPSGENFTELLSYLAEKGIRYSSSFRDDIRPYRHILPGNKPGPVEIPVNFAMDDWNYGMTHRLDPGTLFPKEHVLSIWRDEFDQTREWRGVSTLIMHPQITGRPMRIRILGEFLDYVRKYDDVWFATGAEIAQVYEQNCPQA